MGLIMDENFLHTYSHSEEHIKKNILRFIEKDKNFPEKQKEKFVNRLVQYLKRNKIVEYKFTEQNPFIPVKGSKNIAPILGIAVRTFYYYTKELHKCGAIYYGRNGKNGMKVIYGIPYLLMKWRRSFGKWENKPLNIKKKKK